jgi:hypothetical protein
MVKSRIHFVGGWNVTRTKTWLLGATAVAGFVFLQGCGPITVTYVNQPPSDPYPNARHIEERCAEQTNRISSAVGQGVLGQDSGEGLAENVAMIRQAAYRDRHQDGQVTDLYPDQASDLDAMLNDNAASIEDAIQRHQEWATAFDQGDAYAYQADTPQDRRLYIVHLHASLADQEYAVQSGVQSGRISQDQAQDFNAGIRSARSFEWDCYAHNRRMDLAPDQIIRLRQMVDDNYRRIGRSGGMQRDQRGWMSPDRPRQAPEAVARAGNQGPQAGTEPMARTGYQAPQGSPGFVARADDRATQTGTVAAVRGNGASGMQEGGGPGVTADASKEAPGHSSPSAPGAASGPKAAPGAPKAAPWVAAKALSDRLNAQGAVVKKLKAGGLYPVGPLSKKIADARQALAQDLAANGNKGLTQAQAAQLTGMANDIDKGLPRGK